MTQLNGDMIILSKKKKKSRLGFMLPSRSHFGCTQIKSKRVEKDTLYIHLSQESWSKYINSRQGRLQSKEC